MKIVVVDDSRAMRLLVIRQFRLLGFEGTDFLEAGNGSDAIALVRDSKPDLVVSDWYMPDMTGPDLFRALALEGIRPPFGFITSDTDVRTLVAGLDAGALFLLRKPFTVQELETELRRIFPDRFRA